MRYNRVVIGTGRDAVRAATSAAEQGLRVALVQGSESEFEQVSPRLLRQAAQWVVATGSVSMTALRAQIRRELHSQQTADRGELLRKQVDLFTGDVRFVDGESISVGTQLLTGEAFVLACGTRSARLGAVPFDGRTVLAVEQLLDQDELPRSMIVIGAGRLGLEHAIVMAMLGVAVTVLDEHSNLFDLCGGLMNTSLLEAQTLNIAFRLGDEVIGAEKQAGGYRAAVRLASGRVLTADSVLVCVGRSGRTEGLNLEAAGVGVDEHGRIWCDADGQTWTPHISAVGDVVGFRPEPALAN